jgi:hypothetical protein
MSVRLGEGGSDFWHRLPAGFSRGPPGARQLQHRRVLTLAKISDQHDLSIRELERIVVHRPVIEVDLAEASHLVRQSPGGQKREPSVAFDFFFECKFCPRQQTDGNAPLTGITEAAGDRIWKICRYKLVTDLGGSGRNGVKTIVTHRTTPFVHNPGGAPQHLDYNRTP